MEENTSYAENHQGSKSICWHKALRSLFEYSFSLIATKRTTQNAGSHLQGFADGVCLLRQGLCALHPFFQSAEPGGLKIQIVKQFNPTRPYLLNRQGKVRQDKKSFRDTMHLYCCTFCLIKNNFI